MKRKHIAVLLTLIIFGAGCSSIENRCPVVYTVDLPFSFVVDTVCLPFDALRMSDANRAHPEDVVIAHDECVSGLEITSGN
jgi:uncharacterized protein YceK